MAKKQVVLTSRNINLVLRIRGYVDALLLKQFSYGIFGLKTRIDMEDLDSGLKRLIPTAPRRYPITPETFGPEGETTKAVFEEFGRLLCELVEKDGFGNRKAYNAASELIDAAKEYAKMY